MINKINDPYTFPFLDEVYVESENVLRLIEMFTDTGTKETSK